MRVPKENVLGQAGDGFRVCMWQLNQTRLGCAAGALGVAGGALDLAIKYANERTQFGKAISQHQMIQAQIAEMVVEHQCSADAGLPRRLAEGSGQAEPVRDLGRQARRL